MRKYRLAQLPLDARGFGATTFEGVVKTADSANDMPFHVGVQVGKKIKRRHAEQNLAGEGNLQTWLTRFALQPRDGSTAFVAQKDRKLFLREAPATPQPAQLAIGESFHGRAIPLRDNKQAEGRLNPP